MAAVDRAGHSARPRWIPGHGRSGAFARGRAGSNDAVSGVGRAVLEGWRAVRARRCAAAAGPRADARPHRDAGSERFLRGRDGAADRGRDEGARRAHHGRGSRARIARGACRRFVASIGVTRFCRCRQSAPAAWRSSRCSTSSRASTSPRTATVPPQNVHLIAEAMRRAFADRAAHLGDPAFNPHMPSRSADLEAVRGGAPEDDRSAPGIAIVADELHVAASRHRDDALLGRGRRAQRGGVDLHARIRVRVRDRRARRRFSPEQRDGGLQRRPRI